MCVFCNDMNLNSKSSIVRKKQFTFLSIKPTKPKEYYRFRLLNFRYNSKNDRDTPFIERFVHQKWVNSEDGKGTLETVVCPVTEFVKRNWNGNPYDDCPICRYANMNFVAFRDSGWKDKTSNKKNKEFGRKFEALIPVYVVSDPNYIPNNGKLKVISITDKDLYKKFLNTINYTMRNVPVFNGGTAVDFYLRMENVTETVNPGTAKEYTWSHNKLIMPDLLDKNGNATGLLRCFLPPDKAYPIPGITKELVDDFPFDDEYYVASTKEELEAFYDKYCKVSNDDIPDDDDVAVFEAPKVSKPVAKKSTSTSKPSNIVENTNIVDDDDVADTEEVDVNEAVDDDFFKSDSQPDTPVSEESDDTNIGDIDMTEINNLLK